jgi:heme-degrading monooxygenase HmoA
LWPEGPDVVTLRRSGSYKKAVVHVTVTKTKDELGQPLEVATIAGEEMVRWLRDIDGFEGLLMLSNFDEGTTLVLSFWESREVAEEHREARARLRERVTATVNVEIQETTDFQVTFADLPQLDQASRSGSPRTSGESASSHPSPPPQGR